ncbi:hypothetical protein D3C81_1553900 [compost metagenome]
MQHAIQTRVMGVDSLRQFMALSGSTGQQIQRKPLRGRAVFCGNGLGDLTKFFFIAPEQNHGCTVAGIGQRSFSTDAIAGSGDQNNAIL